MGVRLLKEPLVGGGRLIHADSASGDDVALCGYAHEGAALGYGSDLATEEVSRGRINCPVCVITILYAKGIPARKIEPAARREAESLL